MKKKKYALISVYRGEEGTSINVFTKLSDYNEAKFWKSTLIDDAEQSYLEQGIKPEEIYRYVEDDMEELVCDVNGGEVLIYAIREI